MLAALILATSALHPIAPNNGCLGTCLVPAFLPYGALVVDDVAYFGDHFLGCDEDRPYNLQLQWVSTDLAYYYTPARICHLARERD